ncbi:hypothetical protein [Massilia consociata]|uniref:DUF695 domain-containing protein n=1 Tax=Massilia consociata TaxID=760117 RepID=A0ABV6FIJ7_9BURK
MSYDLMVFSPEAAPSDRNAFLDWYDAQTDDEETHAGDDPGITAPALAQLYKDIIASFPAMNGPFASDELPDDESSLADYSIGPHHIYITFSWDKAEQAYSALHRLAAKHKVGFFDVSSDTGAVWLPANDGGLTIAHEEPL